MQSLNRCARRSPPSSWAAGYPCDERKQIPLFNSMGPACWFLNRTPEAGKPIFN